MIRGWPDVVASMMGVFWFVRGANVGGNPAFRRLDRSGSCCRGVGITVTI